MKGERLLSNNDTEPMTINCRSLAIIISYKPYATNNDCCEITKKKLLLPRCSWLVKLFFAPQYVKYKKKRAKEEEGKKHLFIFFYRIHKSICVPNEGKLCKGI